MKKTPKKAAKKAAPAKKLIDGKYESVFTMRLKPREAKLLNDLKPDLREKTDSGAIRALINRYNPTMAELLDTKKQLNEARKQMNVQGTLLLHLKKGFKDLQDLKLVQLSFNEEDQEEFPSKCPRCGDPIEPVSDGFCSSCGWERF